MNTIILHIGYPKTGTSSVQWFLHTHREQLCKQGIYYPLTGQADDHAHHQLAFALGANALQNGAGAASTLYGSLRQEIDDSGAHTLLLSSEVFLGNLQHLQASRDFANLLEGRAIRVICFVRRQSTFLESLYRHLVWSPRARFAGSAAAFLDAYATAGDYHAPLSMWDAWTGGGKIVTAVYEQALHAGGCIRTFCSLIGLDVTGLPDADFDVQRNTAVAPAAATEAMRIGNASSQLSAEARLEFARHATEFAKATCHLPLTKSLFSADDVARVEARYLESNRKLAERFVKQPLDGMWFKDTRPS